MAKGGDLVYKHTIYLIDGDAIVGRTEGKRLPIRRVCGERVIVIDDFGMRQTIPMASVLFAESEEVEG